MNTNTSKIKPYVPYLILTVLFVIYWIYRFDISVYLRPYDKLTVPVNTANNNQDLLDPGFFPDGFFRNIFKILPYFLLTTLVGFFVTSAVFKKVNGNTAIKLIAGFLPGYLILVPVNRVISLLTPNSHVFAVTILAHLLVLGLCLNYMKSTLIKSFSKSNLSTLTPQILIILLVATFLIPIYIGGGGFLVGDSPFPALNWFTKMWSGPDPLLKKLPLFSEHYDEFVYSYPLFVFFSGKLNMLTLWFIVGFSKVSLFFFIYLILRYFEVSKLLSVTTSIFLFLGSFFSLDPTNYQFAGENILPLLAIPHVARGIGMILPVFLICILMELESRPQDVEIKLAKKLFAFIAIGISGIMALNMLYTLAVFALYLVYRNFYSRVAFPKSLQNFSIFLLSIAILFAIRTYLWPKTGLQGLWLIIPGLCLILFPVYFLDRPHNISLKLTKPKKDFAKYLLILSSVMVVASFTLGNVPTRKLRDTLETKLSSNSFVREKLLPDFIMRKGIIQTQEKPRLFQFQECPTWIEHCRSGFAFMGHFALIFFMALITLILAFKNHRYLVPWILTSVGVLFIMLFMLDFAKTLSSYWIMTRLPEVPIFCIMLAFFVIVSKTKNKTHHYLIALLSMIWSIFPYFSSMWPYQWITNVRFFINHF